MFAVAHRFRNDWDDNELAEAIEPDVPSRSTYTVSITYRVRPPVDPIRRFLVAVQC